MGFIIIGIILLIAGLIINRLNDKIHTFGKPLSGLGGALILIGIITASIVQIDAGNIGIRVLFGNVQPTILQSGLHLINPFIEVVQVDTRTQNYTMSGVHNEGDKVGDDAIRVLSADGLEVTFDLTVLYRVVPDEAPRLFRETGLDYKDKIVRPISRTEIRDNAVYYDAVSLFSTKRDEFQIRISKTIEQEFKKRGLLLENLLIRNISLPTSVKNSIESKINAEQESQKMQFVLQKERQEADRKRVEAQGIADYQRIISESLTDKQLQYEQIKTMKDLAASPNAKIIIMGGKGNTPIMLQQ
ncbi:MAG: prohibitin family protein [Flavipsychrobacter sp.]|nr:prohibitin family protein [Flavipsychrobacter sp.]